MRGLSIAASLALSASVWAADTVPQRLTKATEVFNEVMGSPDKGIPQDLLAKAECLIVIPNMKKAAFIVGGEYGKGFATCRDASHS